MFSGAAAEAFGHPSPDVADGLGDFAEPFGGGAGAGEAGVALPLLPGGAGLLDDEGLAALCDVAGGAVAGAEEVWGADLLGHGGVGYGWRRAGSASLRVGCLC